MAGGGINLSPYEWNALRRLSRGDLSNLLTTLDELGWREAQTMLRRLDARGGYVQHEGENP